MENVPINTYEQPVLPLPEFEQDVLQVQAHEEQVAFEGIRDYLRAWRDVIKSRRHEAGATAPEATQLTLEFPGSGTGSDTDTERDRARLERIRKNREFDEALGSIALGSLDADNDTEARIVAPRTVFQTIRAKRAAKKMVEHEKQAAQEAWRNDFFKGKPFWQETDPQKTKRAQKERKRELKSALKDGEIGLAEYEKERIKAGEIVVARDDKARRSQMSKLRDSEGRVASIAKPTIRSRFRDRTIHKLETRIGDASNETQETVEPATTRLFPSPNAKSFVRDNSDAPQLRTSEKRNETKRAKSSRSKSERPDKKKSREAGISKEALSLFDQAQIEASYDKIEDAIEAGKAARLAELNEGKLESEHTKVFPREELGEVVAEARRAEIEKMLGADYSEENERLLMSAFTAIHRQRMQRAREEA